MSEEMTRDEDLTRSILARTSGAPCASARDRLVPYAEGDLEAFDTELVGLHVARCSRCDGLLRALRQLKADLPLLAEIEPGPQFTAAVLERTVRPRALAARAAGWLKQTVASCLDRPRIAWEGAYVATFLLALVFAAPGSPLAGVPTKALELAQANPVAEIARPAQGLRAEVSRWLSGVREDSASKARQAWGAFRIEVEERSAAIADYVYGGLGTSADRGASERGGNEDGRENTRENGRENE